MAHKRHYLLATVFLAQASRASAATDTIFTALSSLSPSFISNGTHRATDAYTFVPVECLYLEPENVTCAQCSWYEGGSCPLLSLAASSPPPPSDCNTSTPATGYDLPGGDSQAAPITGGFEACGQRCCDSALCTAGWVWVPSAPADFMACKAGQECCYMKGASGTPEKSSVAGIVSATVTKAAQPMLPPPLGLRSAVPLGGVGAGALELRGDGSIHEVTIQNQSPGGAAKYGTFSDALLAVRIGAGAAPAAVRTRPPPGIPGVAGITYSGAYPVSRLTVDDPTVGPAGSNPTVYAYSHLAAGDKVASGKPAVAFTLSLSNPSATEALPVSFALSLPLAGVNDCARNSRVAPVATTQAPSAAACLQACAGNPQCASWTWRGQGPSAGTCTLNGDVPWSVHEEGASCGIAGSWLSASPVALTFSAYPAGLEGNASDSNPGAGDLTLAAVVDPASTTFTNLSVTAGVGDNVTSAWASVFGSSSGAASGADAVPPSGTHGMLSVSGSLPPGSSGTLSIVLAWYFPDRDHVGFDVGNFYSTLYRDSLDVASQLTTSGALASAVSDIAALHSVFTASTLPSWLVDHSINSFSHMRTVIWTRDGRWRQWEAPDCPDVDSIHNDYQRHLPYLWLFPENEVQKMEKWASGQVTEPGNGEFGLIYEYLGAFSLGPLDVPGGRVMADTTSLWVVEALELWRNTGDGDLLQRFYPTVARALTWQVNRARRAGVGIPDHLVNTCESPLLLLP